MESIRTVTVFTCQWASEGRLWVRPLGAALKFRPCGHRQIPGLLRGRGVVHAEAEETVEEVGEVKLEAGQADEADGGPQGERPVVEGDGGVEEDDEAQAEHEQDEEMQGPDVHVDRQVAPAFEAAVAESAQHQRISEIEIVRVVVATGRAGVKAGARGTAVRGAHGRGSGRRGVR
jgi:hypothetical protein